MFREWFKTLLREVFGEEIKQIGTDYVKEQFEETLDSQINEALMPIMKQLHDLNKDLTPQIKEVEKVIKQDIKIARKVITDSLNKTLEQIPKELEKLEVDLSSMQTPFNSRIQNTVLKEINRSDSNHVVNNVRVQFREFCAGHKFINFKE